MLMVLTLEMKCEQSGLLPARLNAGRRDPVCGKQLMII